MSLMHADVNPPLNMSGTPPIGSQLSEYTSVKLQCSLDANPTPSFSIWSSDGMKIQNLGTGQDTINISLTRTHNRLDLYCRADGELADYPVLSAFGSYIIKCEYKPYYAQFITIILKYMLLLIK